MNSNEMRAYTAKDVRQILDRISFQNSVVNFNWKFEIQEVTVTYQGDAEFFDAMQNKTVQAENATRTGWLLWASFDRPDTNTGDMGRGRGRDEIIWQGWTESAVVKTAWVIVQMLIQHELMESYHVDDKRIFNPHNSIARLQSIQE